MGMRIDPIEYAKGRVDGKLLTGLTTLYGIESVACTCTCIQTHIYIHTLYNTTSDESSGPMSFKENLHCHSNSYRFSISSNFA